MDSRYKNKRLLSMKEFCEYVGLGPNKSLEWGREIGAVKHIGRRTLIDLEIVDRAIDNLQAEH